ncbi:hypothetical protein GY45DRAFT_506823 [Cubamyces sp. BRFM 1775]|nr:hypothetical protein GY45DRAFT_506823 [Cubamyces sp. BRFM 1775]
MHCRHSLIQPSYDHLLLRSDRSDGDLGNACAEIKYIAGYMDTSTSGTQDPTEIGCTSFCTTDDIARTREGSATVGSYLGRVVDAAWPGTQHRQRGHRMTQPQSLRASLGLPKGCPLWDPGQEEAARIARARRFWERPAERSGSERDMDLLLRSPGFSDGGVEGQRSGECEADTDARQKV